MGPIQRITSTPLQKNSGPLLSKLAVGATSPLLPPLPSRAQRRQGVHGTGLPGLFPGPCSVFLVSPVLSCCCQPYIPMRSGANRRGGGKNEGGGAGLGRNKII